MMLAAAVTINSIRWLIPTVLMIAPSPIIFVMIQALQLVKPLLGRETYDFFDEAIWSSFQRTVLCFFCNMNSTQVVYSGDYIEFMKSKENALVLSNHQTNVDWICINMLSLQPNMMGRVRYVHKDELKYIPLFGLYFWQHSCINVGRHGTFRESKTVQQLNHLVLNNVPTWLVIFPEGTRYNPSNQSAIKKSQMFAENNDLRPLRQALTPRYRGTYLALQQLHSHLDAVYDITIAYESTRQRLLDSKGFTRTTAPSMAKFILDFSPKLHVNIRRIRMSDVPHSTEREVIQWLHDLFERKEVLMDQFVTLGQFEEGEVVYQPVTKWSQTLPYNCLFLGATACLLMFRSGRIAYTGSAIFGSLAGMLWMKFH